MGDTGGFVDRSFWLVRNSAALATVAGVALLLMLIVVQFMPSVTPGPAVMQVWDGLVGVCVLLSGVLYCAGMVLLVPVAGRRALPGLSGWAFIVLGVVMWPLLVGMYFVGVKDLGLSIVGVRSVQVAMGAVPVLHLTAIRMTHLAGREDGGGVLGDLQRSIPWLLVLLAVALEWFLISARVTSFALIVLLYSAVTSVREEMSLVVMRHRGSAASEGVA